MNTRTSDNSTDNQAASHWGNSSSAGAWGAKHKGMLVILSAIVLVWGICECSAPSEKKQQEHYRKAISAALQADHQASRGVTGKLCVERYESIVRNMVAIDLRTCPQQFATAYRGHVDAWRKAIPLMRRVETLNGVGNMLESFVIGAFAGYTGFWGLLGDKLETDGREADEIKAQASQVDAEITSTYKEVLRIADTYGVDTSSYRVRQ